jgi:hypothetical protein
MANNCIKSLLRARKSVKQTIILMISGFLISILMMTPTNALIINIDTEIPNYFLVGNINLSGTCTNVHGTWSESNYSTLNSGTRKNLTNGIDGLYLIPKLNFNLLNNGESVLKAGKLGEWDHYIERSCMVKINGTYYLFYTGAPEKLWGSLHYIGLATSQDRIHWVKSPNPILSPGGYDQIHVKCPRVFVENGTWWLYYTGGISTDEDICLALSTDGRNWTKFSNNPVLKNGHLDSDWNGVYSLCSDIRRENGIFKMIIKGGGSEGKCMVGSATSTDGVLWNYDPENPFYQCPDDGWQEGYADFGPLECYSGTNRLWVAAGNPDHMALGWIYQLPGNEWLDSGGPVFSPVPGSDYSSGFDTPALIFENGGYFMMLRCVDSSGNYVFMAFEVTPYYLEGEYLSERLDIGCITTVKETKWTNIVPPGSSITVHLGWSNSSSDSMIWRTLLYSNQFMGVEARFLQYRIQFISARDWLRPSFISFFLNYSSAGNQVLIQIDNGTWKTTNGTPENWYSNLQLNEGIHSIIVQATDDSGNIAKEEIILRVDLFPPAGTIILEDGHSFSNSSMIHYNITAEDDNGIEYFMISSKTDFNGILWHSFQSKGLLPYIGPDGTITIIACLKDYAGRQSNIFCDSIIVDTEPPIGNLLIENGQIYCRQSSEHFEYPRFSLVDRTMAFAAPSP